MFTTTHDAVLIIIAAMFFLLFLANSAFVISGRGPPDPGGPFQARCGAPGH